MKIAFELPEPLAASQGLPIAPGRIGFDIDGVVADTVEAFVRIMAEEYGETVEVEKITDFTVEECLDLDPGQVSHVFDRLMRDPLGCGLKPMAGAVEVLQEFSRHAPLTFVTARPLLEPIGEWLAVHLGREAMKACRLIATGDHDGKGEYIKRLQLDAFVDDRAQTCIQLNAQGIIPFVYDQPWNRGRHRFPTVRNWDEIRFLVQLEAKP